MCFSIILFRGGVLYLKTVFKPKLLFDYYFRKKLKNNF